MSEPQPPLYSPYDLDTGIPTVESIDRAFRADLEVKAAQGQKVYAMAQTDGWKFISDWMFQQINNCKEKLIDEQDMQSIIRYQQTARALSNVLGFVEEQISISKFLPGPTEP
jgi:hypothetical protein